MSISSFCALIHKTTVFFALDSSRPTLGDVVDRVEHVHKRRCSCGRFTGSEAWFDESSEEQTRVDATERSSSGSDSGYSSLSDSSSSVQRRYLRLGDRVADLGHPVVFTATYGKPSAAPIYPERCCPTGCIHRPERLGDTCFIEVCPDSPMCIPEPSMCTLTSFPNVSGTVYVDKTAIIDFLSGPGRYRKDKLPLVRRPAGFGKTTFLSTLIKYHDCIEPALTDYIFSPTICWTPNAPEPNQHLVLYFDFSRVPVGPNFKNDFESYLRQVALKFLDKYDDLLHIPQSTKSSLGNFGILHRIFVLVVHRHYTVYLTVDNFNAMHLKAQSIDDADELDGEFVEMVNECIDRAFCQPIEGATHSVVKDGLIVGTSDCGYADPIGVFDGISYDMTYKSPLRGIFGFTDKEVEQLGKLFCWPNDFLEEVRRSKKVRRFNEIHTARREKWVLGYDPRTVGYTSADYEMMEADGIKFKEDDKCATPEDSDDMSSDDESEVEDLPGVVAYSMADVLGLLRERVTPVYAASL
ncbi:hypothetical protein FISHEDRAFT_69807 [Fistulina hepatica ATCC 64428]|uniref:AAA-ATPase-like domain-containing protein n=1 Tax=Fistulina hepatica ATCC 64428 TaxID=1128425 RepID=A0A0D7AKJ4_9AGAR|nr:hypothetical protein FISHEDRAFT_69807 [Fistulina hepatica ATCC 64428]